MVATFETELQFNVPATAIGDRLADLEVRLHRGLAIIHDRTADGLPVDRYEEHWLSLLAEYEALYDANR